MQVMQTMVNTCYAHASGDYGDNLFLSSSPSIGNRFELLG